MQARLRNGTDFWQMLSRRARCVVAVLSHSRFKADARVRDFAVERKSGWPGLRFQREEGGLPSGAVGKSTEAFVGQNAMTGDDQGQRVLRASLADGAAGEGTADFFRDRKS